MRSRAAGDAQGWEAHLADFDDDGQDSLPPLGVPRYLLSAPRGQNIDYSSTRDNLGVSRVGRCSGMFHEDR